MNDARDAWHKQRARAVHGHAVAIASEHAAQAEAAAALLVEFVRSAEERGLAAGALFAQSLDGRSRYRTRLRGWYLKANRTVAVGRDGAFYILTVPSSLRARITGATPQPSPPRLIIGAGGGDGETMPLAQLLKRRLDAGVAWPC